MTQKYIFNLDSCDKKTDHEVTFDEAVSIIANTMLHEDVHDFIFCKDNYENECIPVTRLNQKERCQVVADLKRKYNMDIEIIVFDYVRIKRIQ